MDKIEIRDLTKHYGDLCAADHVSFSISSGKITALCGKNGSGKSTTIHCMLGILFYENGTLLKDGEKWDIDYRSIGYLPEERGMFLKEKVNTQLLYFAKLKGFERADAIKSMNYWLERFELGEVAGKKLGDLSKGNQQKVQIIASLIHNPEIIIWDEPFSGLDPVNMQVLVETLVELKERNTCVLISSHQLNLLEDICEDICVIDQGKVRYYGTVFDFKQKYGEKFIYFTTKKEISETKEIKKCGPYEYRIKITNENEALSKLQWLLHSNYEIENYGKKSMNLQETFISLINNGEEI